MKIKYRVKSINYNDYQRNKKTKRLNDIVSVIVLIGPIELAYSSMTQLYYKS